ncbi:MAG: zf-HC2 domain-containing protein [Ruminococcus sp.]|nr:zf-HC2 domain-containing protein [Ruminococcus sp.]
MKNSCDVIQDLFVPYLDDTCSEESRRLLNEHLESCEKCKKAFESYQQPLLEIDMQSNIKSKKPFKKIKRRVKTLIAVIVLLLIIILPVAVYQIYGRTHSFYEADRLFLGLDDSDFINAAQGQQINSLSRQMYRSMYYTLQSRNGTAKEDMTYDELVEERNALSSVKCDFEKTEIIHEDYDGVEDITMIIPLILPDNSVPTVVKLYGRRIGCGKYCFTEFMLYPKNLQEENYDIMLSQVGTALDTLDMWPFSVSRNWVVKSWKKYEPVEITESEPDNTSKDTGKKIPTGVYEYTESSGVKQVITVYDNGKLMFELENYKSDNSSFPHYVPSMLNHIHLTANPCQYFIVEDDGKLQLMIRYEKSGLKGGSITFEENGDITYKKRTYVKQQ